MLNMWVPARWPNWLADEYAEEYAITPVHLGEL